MHGNGTFFDPRLDNAAQFPIAAENRFGHLASEHDSITAKLPALHLYQLALPAPAPPAGSFDAGAAERGDALFSGKARCASCHTEGTYTEPGWNMHTGAEIGIDEFQADRGPDHRYRTSPLKGLWTHAKGGFFHDGRFPTLAAVVDHYDTFFHLGLTAGEKSDLVEYLKSLGDTGPSTVRDAVLLNAAESSEEAADAAVVAGAQQLDVWPLLLARGDPLHVRLASAPTTGVEVAIFDLSGRAVARLRRPADPAPAGDATLLWDGRDDAGHAAAPGVYFLRARIPASGFEASRRIVIR